MQSGAVIASNVSVPAKLVGMHYKNYTSGAPTEAVTYGPKLWRSHSGGTDWRDIETSDNVFNFARLQSQIAYFTGQGQDIYYQLYGTPATARAAGATWTTVPDQDGAVGAGCAPDATKCARFVTALLTACPQIKWISPWNETKWGLPVVRFAGTRTGTMAKDTQVVGLTSGARGTLTTDATTNQLVVRLDDYSYSATPFANSETIQVVGDAARFFVATQQAAVHYWYGTLDQLVMHCHTVYQAAKAANPLCLVTTPDFEGGSIAGEAEWLDLFIARCYALLGYLPFDVVANHFYNMDYRPATKIAEAYSLPQQVANIDAILAKYGISNKPRIASECGFTSGWGGWLMQSDRPSQAATIQRVAHYLALKGWPSIWYDHTEEYGGAPAVNAAVAAGYKAAQSIAGTVRTGYVLANQQIASVDQTGRWYVT